MSRNTPTFASVLAATLEARLADVHTAIPCRVESYDATTASVSVQPLIRRGHTDNESGERMVERLPVITGVPVCFPGSGAFSLDWPVAKGDTGMLVFSEASIDKWLTRGGDVDPLDDRRFSLNDAMFIPGLRPRNAPPGTAPAGTMVLRTSGQIHAGGDQSLALKADVDALRTAFNAHTHVYSPGPSSPAPTAPPAAPAPANVGTTVLKGG